MSLQTHELIAILYLSDGPDLVTWEVDEVEMATALILVGLEKKGYVNSKKIKEGVEFILSLKGIDLATELKAVKT